MMQRKISAYQTLANMICERVRGVQSYVKELVSTRTIALDKDTLDAKKIRASC